MGEQRINEPTCSLDQIVIGVRREGLIVADAVRSRGKDNGGCVFVQCVVLFWYTRMLINSVVLSRAWLRRLM